MSATALPEKLPTRTKLFYGLGDWGFSLTGTMLAVYFAMFLSDVVHLNLRLAAAAIFLGRSWDWINDPLVGYLTDRTRTRWGRRRPFLLFGFIPFGLTFAMLWWIPPTGNQMALAAYYGLAYLLCDAAATFVYMPYFALTPELTLDYDERTSLTSYRMAFSIVGSLIAFTIPLLLVGDVIPANAGHFALMGLLFGIISGLPLLLVFFNTRERPEFQAQREPSLKESLQAALRNKPFLFAVGVFLLTWTTMDILMATLLFFLKYRMGMDAGTSDTVLGTIFVVALLTLPFWTWAARHWDKRLAYAGGVAFWAVVQIVLVVIRPNWGLPVVLLLAAMAGIGVGAAHVMPWSIIPDAVEWDELATGQRHEGMFYSLVNLLYKVASSLAVPLVLLVLGWTGYQANAPTEPPQVVLGIQILVGPVPAVLLCAGIAFALMYPLSRARHTEVRKELEKRRREGG